MQSNTPMLSIYVPTYNHEKYIGMALESILGQKTRYSYEVLIGDDASQDGTRAVIEQYEKRFPQIFTVFYRETNMKTIGKSNIRDLKERCSGKYIIALEGDDYWTDDEKIEKQINFLENNPEYLAVAHNCVVVDENSNMTSEKYPECKDEEYSIEHFADNILPGQTTTLMVRNYIKDSIFDTTLLNQGFVPGDRVLAFTLAVNGRVYCMQECMSAYRHITHGGSSFSATYKYDFANAESVHLAMMRYAKKCNNQNAVRCAELLYLRNLIKGIMNEQVEFFNSFKYLKAIKHKVGAFKMLIEQQIRQKSFRNDPNYRLK